jgi:hypothetical protein
MIRLRNKLLLISAWIIFLGIFLAACGTTYQPGNTIYAPSNLPQPTPTSTLRAVATSTSSESYKLTFHNRYDGDIYIFLDDQFTLKIAAHRSGTYAPVSAGEHTLEYCQDRQRLSCEAAQKVAVYADAILVASNNHSIAPVTGIAQTQLPVIATLGLESSRATPTAIRAIEHEGASPTAGPPPVGQPNSATLTALAPTLAALAPTQTAIALRPQSPTPTSLPPEKAQWKITVHNRFTSPLVVYLDEKYLMTVPSAKYLYFLNIQGGPHKLKFCPDDKWCIRRDIYLTQDTVYYIGP